MPHHPKPFFKANRNTWYVEIDRVQHPLGKHPDALPPPQKKGSGWEAPREILDAYHRKMAELQQAEAVPPAAVTAPAVATVLDEFAGWLAGRVAEGSKAPRTLAWYTDYLTSFLDFLRREEPGRQVPTLTADQLEPLHVYRWVDAHPDWKAGKRGAMVAVQCAFNWAAKAGLLKALGGRSPLAGLEKPPQGRREQLVTAEEFAIILSLARDREFADLLESAWQTGVRPHELFTVEARFVDLANARWVFPVRQSKGKKTQRVVYLTDKALAITRRLMQEHPEGPLFRNTDGMRWCVSSVKSRFQRLRDELGRRRLKGAQAAAAETQAADCGSAQRPRHPGGPHTGGAGPPPGHQAAGQTTRHQVFALLVSPCLLHGGTGIGQARRRDCKHPHGPQGHHHDLAPLQPPDRAARPPARGSRQGPANA